MYKYVFILFFATTSAISQTLLTNTPNRNVASLNGSWHYIIDPYETGYYNYRYQPYDQTDPDNSSAFFNNYHPKNTMELVEYDFDKSPTLWVPGDWNSQKSELLYYEGTIWYKKSFQYQKAMDSNRVFLYFGASNYFTEVYLNGKKLGTHEGGFTPFTFEVTNVLQSGDNYVVVKVDNTRHKEAIPTINTDWWNYGGITRDVKLIEEPAVFIEDYNLALDANNPNRIVGELQLNGAQEETKVNISIPELKLSKSVMTDDGGKARFSFVSKKIEYWSPEVAKLYDVELSTDFQLLKDQIGFRTIKTDGPDILLNGKSIFLRGICIHEENGPRGGRAFSDADALLSLTMAKELGCNYVRLAHYPHNEHIIRMADKMGLMVWEEIPVYWTVEFSNPETLQKAKTQLEEAIKRDKNRASIIIWSMANETPPSEHRNNFIKQLVDLTRSLDDTRLVSAALEKHNKNGVNIVDDVLGNYLDIVAFNQYTGWYGGSLENAPDSKWDIQFNKPVVISEFGGGALQGLHGSIKERWTEEYQEYLYQQNLKMIDRIPNIRGTSPWILMDFRSPKRVLPEIQDGWNRKGLISNRGLKKKAYHVMHKYYENKKTAYSNEE